MTLSEDSAEAALAGEVDVGNVAALAEALEPLLAGAGDVRLDCERLAFLAVAGVRILEETAGRLGPDRRLVLVSPSTAVRRIIGLLRTDRLPNVAIEAAPGGD